MTKAASDEWQKARDQMFAKQLRRYVEIIQTCPHLDNAQLTELVMRTVHAITWTNEERKTSRLWRDNVELVRSLRRQSLQATD